MVSEADIYRSFDGGFTRYATDFVTLTRDRIHNRGLKFIALPLQRRVLISR